MTRRARPALAGLTAAALGSSLLLAGGGVPAAAQHTPSPARVTVMGDLMDELGCAQDWDETCTATDLEASAGSPGQYSAVVDLPAGRYELKVRLNGSWAENYGAGGAADGPNVPLVLAGDASVRIGYDHATHLITVEPGVPQPGLGPADEALAGTSLRADLTRERFYFVMADRFANGRTGNDTGGLAPDRLVSGFDPRDPGFFHGGDLQGVIDKLDYIEGLGTTAIWLTPSFENRPVQGAPGAETAGYHGYWVTDFTRVDPHLGTNEDMAALVAAAHARGIKVFFDIITNHTADVITYADFDAGGNLPYVSTADAPYRDAAGTAFDDRDYADGATPFPVVGPGSFPYAPVVDPADRNAKTPAWLNDPALYHNRGVSTFAGESNTYGDFPSGPFSSLDDLWTEHPTVVQGMIDIYSQWVAGAGIDGFRIDTVKHVNTEFWQQFAPALTGYAASLGNDDFFMFGEVFDANPAFVSQYTTTGRLQAAVDFGFQANGTAFARGRPTTQLRDFFAADDRYTDADSNAYSLPTFLGNHDMGRIGSFLRQGVSDEQEVLDRDRLAHSLMYLTRGQPVVYYGDEQGFAAPPDEPGGVGDRRAREDMFASQVAAYNDNDLIGTDATTAVANFDPAHPLYAHIAGLARLRADHPALADGAQVHRYASNEAGVYAFSRVDAQERVEYVVAVNNATSERAATFDTFAARARYRGLWPAGTAALRSDTEGRVTVTVPPLSAVVYRADAAIPAGDDAPQPAFATPLPGGVVGERAEVRVVVPGGGFDQATLAWRPVGTTDWQVIGTDDNAPYRVFHDVRGLTAGTLVEYRAVVRDADGDLGVAATHAVVGTPPAPGGGGGGPVVQPASVSVPGDFNDEVGCPQDWQPECPAVDLALDEPDQLWRGTIGIPTGSFVHKVAINDAWDENYGRGGVRNGENIELSAPGTPVDFYYSHDTHWVTNSVETPELFGAAGSFQSELGCSGDWQPECLRSWLQDPDGDGTWVFRTTQLPPGSYEAKVAVDESWDVNYGAGGVPNGSNIAFAVADGEGVQMAFDETSKVLTTTTFPATGGAVPDLGAQRAHWLSRSILAWDLPAARPGWTYRLHWAAEGGLALDAETVTGGSSVPLTPLPDGLPAALRAQDPHLAGLEALQLGRPALREVPEILTAAIAVAAYDDLSRLVDATGVQLPRVLDDVYREAAERTLGLSWEGRTPTLALWAPTAKDVDLLLQLPGTATESRVALRRDAAGVWTVRGNPRWKGAAYRFDVRVYVPATGRVESNLVTDPYSLALTTNSRRSVVVDLGDRQLAPPGWDRLRKPSLTQPEDSTIYELHVRDFSISDETVPAAERGTYAAFDRRGSDGMRHLRGLADAGMNTVHLLPTFDIATIEERRDAQAQPPCDLEALTAAPGGSASPAQQECVDTVAATDGFNWGYDPFHYTTPEGSYATDPEGPRRTLEYRRMVAALNRAGLRVVQDVVYNHTAQSGQGEKSVLDRVVPGYYHRLDASGGVQRSTCCENTATEHAMMGKLMVDSVVTWARAYKVDGFRFDLMGHHSKQNMLTVRRALDRLTPAKDGVDGRHIYLYGEGWNFGEVANDARFVQATQANMAGTGIGTFTDRLRDAVRGGGPFDDPRVQGFASGLRTQPNGSPVNGDAPAQDAELLLSQDQIKVGLAGNLAGFRFVDRTGASVTGAQVDYNGSPAGYAADPCETVTYVDAHDNETLFDALTMKLAGEVSAADRARMNTLGLSTTVLSQGVSFWHAGADILRSKSLDRNSYDSGDWFNEVDWGYARNGFGRGLPPERDNAATWDVMRPLLDITDLRPSTEQITAARERAEDLLAIRFSSPLFRLGSARLVQERVSFPQGGPDQPRGVITMVLDDTAGADLDRRWERVVVVWNATAFPTTQVVPGVGGARFALHPIQARGADPVVRQAAHDAAGGTFRIPARTVAVFVAR